VVSPSKIQANIHTHTGAMKSR